MSDRGELFLENRDRLFGLAYRMLGSAADADDVVQEAFLRFKRRPGSSRRSLRLPHDGHHATSPSTNCDDCGPNANATSAPGSRSPWLARGIPAEEQTALAESLSQAMLVVLETLEPAERAVFLLREVFEIDYDQIAEIIGQTTANCRQLLHRAKERISAGRAKPRGATPEEHDRLTQQFFASCVSGDLDGLKSLLADDVVSYHDGGGKLHARASPALRS